MKNFFWTFLILLALVFAFYYLKEKNSSESQAEINNFIDCKNAGNLIMESYPRQCRSADGRLFVEDIGNILEKYELISLNSPLPNQEVSSPLEIRGSAHGPWYFEADFPVALFNSEGEIIAEGAAIAQSDWMTEDFVPFLLNLDFPEQESNTIGRLFLYKDNPSGLAEHYDHLELPVVFR